MLYSIDIFGIQSFSSEDSEYLLPWSLLLPSRRRWRLKSQGQRLKLFIRLLLALAKDHGDGILGLDAVHLHIVLALHDVVLVLGAVLEGAEAPFLLVHDHDILPLQEEGEGLAPEIGEGGQVVLEGGVGGVVQEEGEDAHDEERSLRWGVSITGSFSLALYQLRRSFCQRIEVRVVHTMVIKTCRILLCQNQCDHVPSGAIIPGYDLLLWIAISSAVGGAP